MCAVLRDSEDDLLFAEMSEVAAKASAAGASTAGEVRAYVGGGRGKYSRSVSSSPLPPSRDGEHETHHGASRLVIANLVWRKTGVLCPCSVPALKGCEVNGHMTSPYKIISNPFPPTRLWFDPWFVSLLSNLPLDL